MVRGPESFDHGPQAAQVVTTVVDRQGEDPEEVRRDPPGKTAMMLAGKGGIFHV